MPANQLCWKILLLSQQKTFPFQYTYSSLRTKVEIFWDLPPSRYYLADLLLYYHPLPNFLKQYLNHFLICIEWYRPRNYKRLSLLLKEVP